MAPDSSMLARSLGQVQASWVQGVGCMVLSVRLPTEEGEPPCLQQFSETAGAKAAWNLPLTIPSALRI